MQPRVILHSDMNSFYASVEMMLDPSLRGKAVAVCGSTENRHGIVLAKSQLAKKAGVKEMWLTHYSPSLVRPEPYMDAVKKIFPQARPGKDGKSITLAFEEE